MIGRQYCIMGKRLAKKASRSGLIFSKSENCLYSLVILYTVTLGNFCSLVLHMENEDSKYPQNIVKITCIHIAECKLSAYGAEQFICANHRLYSEKKPLYFWSSAKILHYGIMYF